MQTHAHEIQAILAREHAVRLPQAGLVRAGLLSVPPRPQAPPAAARAQAAAR